MTLAHPLALWLLVLLPVPLLLARRRTPARRLRVSNLYLWRSLNRLETARPTLRKIRRDWLVALQMAFIAIVIAALAQPAVTLQSARVAFVIDVSASMAATDGPVSRFDRARTLARSALRALPRRSRVRVIAAGASPRDLGDYAVNDPALARALETLTPTAGPSDLGSAVRLARIADATADVHVFSDRPLKDVKDVTEASDGARGAIAWETVGQAADNLAIARLAARRLPFDPVGGQVLVTVQNYGSRSHDAEIEISQDGQPLGRETLHLTARGAQTLVVPSTRLGHVVSARLLADDALDADNHRWTVVPALERVRVGLGKDGSSFLRHALAVNPSISVEDLLPVPSGGAPGDGGESAPVPTPDVAVCADCGDWSRSRGVLMVPPRAESRNPSALTVAQPDHPLAASLDLEGVFAAPLPSRLAGAGEVIVRSGGLPAVIAYEHDGRRAVEFCFDVEGSDITLSPAFPLLVANAVEWLAARNENHLELESGEPLRWTLPESPAANNVAVTGPDGRTVQAQVQGTRLTVADTDRPGVYHVKTPRAEQVFVVNPAVDSESDLIPAGQQTTVPVTTNPTGYAPRDIGIAPLLLLLASATFAAEWWYRRGRTMWRLVIAACLLLAASGLAVAPRPGHVEMVAVVDRSASIPVTAQERSMTRVNALASTMRAGDRLGVVAFGADAVVERRPSDRAPLSGLSSAVVDTGTNIEAALGLGRSLLSREGRGDQRRMLLISDGRETSGDARKEAAYAAAAGVRVDVVPSDLQGTRHELAVSRVVVPSDARVNEPFLISVEIEGSAGARGQLSVYRDDEPLGAQEISVSSAGTTNVAFSGREPQQGTHTYRALVKDLDDDFNQATGDTASGAVVTVSGEPAVLYVSSSVSSAAGPGNLRPVLAPAGFHVVPASPESLPASAVTLRAYDAVVLDDVPSARLSTAQTSALAEYVERLGGGLLLLGSPRSLDIAGYPTSSLGRVLPIDLRPRAGQRAPSLGLVLVFDKSGSMADLADGTPKIELARQGVKRVLDILPPTDAMGVIAFDAEPVVVAPLASPPDAPAITDRLRRVAAAGPTRIAPAIELALQWLHGPAGVNLSRRKILLVSDGRTSAEDAQRLRAALGNAGVELSVVAIGSNADRDLLSQLAQSTGGRAYFPTDVTELPLLVSREAARSRTGTVVEERFTLRGAPHPILGGIDRGALPQLSGYVVSAVRPTATSILSSHLDDPILSVWHAGLGRAAVFTADLGSPWSASLRGWQDFARLWTQSVRWVSRRSDDPALAVAIAEEDGGMHVSVEATDADGKFLNLANGRAIVRPPAGDASEIALAASAPGQYDAHLHATNAGPYVIEVEGQDADSGTEHRVVRGFYWSADRERRARGADTALLRAIAETTGGRPLGPTDSPFSETRPTEFVDISVWVVGAALALFLLDLLVRRGLVIESVRRWVPAPRRAGQDRHAA